MRFGQSAGASGRKFPGWLSLLALLFISAVSPVLGAESPSGYFCLKGLTATEPVGTADGRSIHQRLKEQSSEDIEVYSDFLDLGRFQGPANENRLIQFLGREIRAS